MATEQVETPVYKPSPFMKAAAQIIEASEGHVPDDLHWDPLTMSYGGGSGLPGDAIELPTELMMNLVGPGLAAVRQTKPTPEVSLNPSQERAKKRLQQRKEAAAREAAEKAAQQEREVEEPLDESWIDQLEQKDAKKKAKQEKAVQIRKDRKKARKADAAAKQEALESAEVPEEVEEVVELEPVQPEPVEIDDEDDMQPVEQSKQRRKRQARQAAREREEAERARQEEERKREEEVREAERKREEAEALKARMEQERLEQERKRLEEQREAERQKEEELARKREAEKREAERRAAEKEAEKRKQEEARERREQREQREKEREAKKAQEAKDAESKEDKIKEEVEEARADGDRRRRETRDEPKGRQGRKQDKDEAKETGEQPTQVKSLRQTLTPSQLRRQQRKRQREARRAAEAAAREDDESEEELEAKPKAPERKQSDRTDRPSERNERNERQNERNERQNERPVKAEEAERPKAEEGKRARGGSVSSVASWDSAARKEDDSEPPDAPRTNSELRKDAEAFPTPRDSSSRMQEMDQNMMQPVMGITTLMISQIPEQTDAESFRRQLDSWGFIGTYNFFYMPPDVSEGWGGRCVFINFIDQAMANMCMSAFQQCPSEGVAAPYNVQGLESNIAHFSQFVGAGDMVNGPLIVPTPTPSAWALNGAQAMMSNNQGKFSPQIRGQFHKTKMCAFHKKKKCTMGVACPFAHCKEELNAPPDLSKTKLCVNFFRRKCNDVNCKFAHGHSELRATGSVYKTELCRAWTSGTCKAGDTCRYAHGVKELRGAQMGMGYMGFGMDDDYMSSIDGQMGCDVMGGLQGIWEDEAAAMQHYNGYGGMSSSYPQGPQGSGDHRGRSAPSSGFSSGQPQDGTAEGFNDAMSDMGLSDVSTLCPGEGRLSRQQTAPPTASFPDTGRSVHSNVVLRVKGTFMESVFLDEEVERLPLRRSWSDGDLPQLQDMEGEQDL